MQVKGAIGVVAMVGLSVGASACSSTPALTLDSTCREYFRVAEQDRRDQVNQLGLDANWIGAGNPLYLVDLETACGQLPDSTLAMIMKVDGANSAAAVPSSAAPTPSLVLSEVIRLDGVITDPAEVERVMELLAQGLPSLGGDGLLMVMGNGYFRILVDSTGMDADQKGTVADNLPPSFSYDLVGITSARRLLPEGDTPLPAVPADGAVVIDLPVVSDPAKVDLVTQQLAPMDVALFGNGDGSLSLMVYEPITPATAQDLASGLAQMAGVDPNDVKILAFSTRS